MRSSGGVIGHRGDFFTPLRPLESTGRPPRNYPDDKTDHFRPSFTPEIASSLAEAGHRQNPASAPLTASSQTSVVEPGLSELGWRKAK